MDINIAFIIGAVDAVVCAAAVGMAAVGAAVACPEEVEVVDWPAADWNGDADG